MTDRRTRRRAHQNTLSKRAFKKRPFLATNLGRKAAAAPLATLAKYIDGKLEQNPRPLPKGFPAPTSSPGSIAMDTPLPIDKRAPSLGRFSVWYRKLPAF